MKIKLDADPEDAPGCLKVHLLYRNGRVVRTMLVQMDWDFPHIARAFGWDMSDRGKCKHEHTDATVDCPDCGKKVHDFISDAMLWLDEHDGTIVDDPGYFEEE